MAQPMPAAATLTVRVCSVLIKGSIVCSGVYDCAHYVEDKNTVAFADISDPRVRTRLAWLSDITLTLQKLSTFPIEVTKEKQLREFVQAGAKAAEPDSLGHPRQGKKPLLWARWNIAYVGDLADFLRRAQEVEAATQLSPNEPEPEE